MYMYVHVWYNLEVLGHYDLFFHMQLLAHSTCVHTQYTIHVHTHTHTHTVRVHAHTYTCIDMLYLHVFLTCTRRATNT